MGYLFIGTNINKQPRKRNHADPLLYILPLIELGGSVRDLNEKLALGDNLAAMVEDWGGQGEELKLCAT